MGKMLKIVLFVLAIFFIAAGAIGQSTYTFIGKGQWQSPNNWENGQIPPATLNNGDQVIINGKGPALLNGNQLFTIVEGSSLLIIKGKTLYINRSEHFINDGGLFFNHGIVKVISGSSNISDKIENSSTGQIVYSKLAELSIANAKERYSPANISPIIDFDAKRKRVEISSEDVDMTKDITGTRQKGTPVYKLKAQSKH